MSLSSLSFGNPVRRLCFSCPRKEQNVSSFYSRTRQPFQPVDMNELYVPESPEHPCMQENVAWQPGDMLPISNQHASPSQMPYSTTSPNRTSSISQIQSILQSMQSSIETNFRDVKGRLTELEARMTGVEEKQREVVNNVHVGTPSSSSSESATEFGRKRRSPPELQVHYCKH